VIKKVDKVDWRDRQSAFFSVVFLVNKILGLNSSVMETYSMMIGNVPLSADFTAFSLRSKPTAHKPAEHKEPLFSGNSGDRFDKRRAGEPVSHPIHPDQPEKTNKRARKTIAAAACLLAAFGTGYLTPQAWEGQSSSSSNNHSSPASIHPSATSKQPNEKSATPSPTASPSSDESSQTGTTPAKEVKVTGTNYYVDSVKGSDSNDGLSEDKPLKSLDKVNQLDLKPGDGVSFAKGSTFKGELDVKNNGTEDKPIVYRAYGSGDMPVFKNPGGDWNIAINVTGSNNVLDGLKLEDATIGVQFADGADNNTLQNSEAAKVGRGVDVEGDGNNILSNYFHDLKMVVNTPGGDDDNGANAVVIHSSNTTFANNRCDRNVAPSYDYKQDGGAVEIYAFKGKPIKNTRILDNTSSDSDGFIEVGAEDGASVIDTLVKGNTSKNNNGVFSVLHNAGTSGSSDGALAEVKNFVIEGNTIIEKTTDPNDLFIDGGTVKDNNYQKLP
jgi:hypothetical protein